MITPRPYEQKLQQQQQQRVPHYTQMESSYQLPFPPPVPPPPLPPSSSSNTIGGWGGSGGNNQQQHYVEGGTWQTAAIYSGAVGQQNDPRFQQQYGNHNNYQNETVPIGHQVPPYIANRESFPHQQNNNNNGSISRNSRSGSNPQQQQQQTASGLEVHAMQRLVNSAKTRFGPSSSSSGNQQQQYSHYQDPNNNSNSNFYQEGQDYFEQSQQQNNVLVAESHARREKLLNSHRNSGGVAYEEKLRRHREKLIQKGTGPVTQPIVNIDGTFRRTKTPQPGGSSSSLLYQQNSSRYPMPSGKFSIGGAGNKRLGGASSSSAIPLSQAQTSMLVSGIRPSASSHLPVGATTKSKLKGEAPDLKKSLAEGFGMRFQPEQIEQMQLPDSVGEAALEVSRYYRSAAGGFDNSKRQNPHGPETSYIHGVGDMFNKMKGQYLQMQKLSSGGNNNSKSSPVPRNPNQQLFRKYHQGGDDGGSSPLKAAQHHVLGNNNNNNSSRNNNNTTIMMSSSSNMANTTPLYSIAGTGAYRESDQIITSSSNNNYSPNRSGMMMNNSNNNNFSSSSRQNDSAVKFDAPKPSARALALRSELEALEKQWKDLHENSSSSGSHNHDNNNVSKTSPEPLHPGSNENAGSTRDQVLGRISAVLS